MQGLNYKLIMITSTWEYTITFGCWFHGGYIKLLLYFTSDLVVWPAQSNTLWSTQRCHVRAAGCEHGSLGSASHKRPALVWSSSSNRTLRWRQTREIASQTEPVQNSEMFPTLYLVHRLLAGSRSARLFFYIQFNFSKLYLKIIINHWKSHSGFILVEDGIRNTCDNENSRKGDIVLLFKRWSNAVVEVTALDAVCHFFDFIAVSVVR